MPQIVETHIRKRGFFGWLFLVLFWVFNAWMALRTFSALSVMTDHYAAADSGPARAGAEIGGAMAAAIMLFFWAAGAVILGLFVLVTRGDTVVMRADIDGVAAPAALAPERLAPDRAPGLDPTQSILAAILCAIAIVIGLVLMNNTSAPLGQSANQDAAIRRLVAQHEAQDRLADELKARARAPK